MNLSLLKRLGKKSSAAGTPTSGAPAAPPDVAATAKVTKKKEPKVVLPWTPGGKKLDGIEGYRGWFGAITVKTDQFGLLFGKKGPWRTIEPHWIIPRAIVGHPEWLRCEIPLAAQRLIKQREKAGLTAPPPVAKPFRAAASPAAERAVDGSATPTNTGPTKPEPTKPGASKREKPKTKRPPVAKANATDAAAEVQ